MESPIAVKVIIISNDNDNDNNNDNTASLANFNNTIPLVSSNHVASLASFSKYNIFFILNFKTYITNNYIIFLL